MDLPMPGQGLDLPLDCRLRRVTLGAIQIVAALAISSAAASAGSGAAEAPRPLSTSAPAAPTAARLAMGEDDLHSNYAIVIDQATNEVLLSKNERTITPIASITKLMTSYVISQSKASMDEVLTITEDDIDTEKFTRSRLAVGTRLSRRQLLHLALMSSENRAAHALARSHPGGLEAFIKAMNSQAVRLGMANTRFVDPTGLSSGNQSTAQDLARLVSATQRVAFIREMSTARSAGLSVGRRRLSFVNTNSLVRGGTWDIALQKTGYIVEAGVCVVMKVKMAGRDLVMVLLNSDSARQRVADAQAIRAAVLRIQKDRGHAAAHAAATASIVPVALHAGREPAGLATPNKARRWKRRGAHRHRHR